MWFKRKSINRRLKTDHVLDVKMSTEKLRAMRLRMATRVMTLVFGTAFVLFIFWRGGEWVLNEYIFQNATFAVENIEVQSDGVISQAALRQWSGVKPGDNLLALDLGRVKRDLEINPLIQSTSVERILPHTLRIQVVEREPIASVAAVLPRPSGGYASATFLIDQAGWVMWPLSPQFSVDPQSVRYDQLPKLIGVNAVELRLGRQIEAQQVRAALRLITEFENSSMAGVVEIRSIDVSSPETLKVITGMGSVVTFAAGGGIGDQLRHWRQTYDLGMRSKKAILSLDLSISNNIPALWLEASQVPPANPKNGKTIRVKKKNV